MFTKPQTLITSLIAVLMITLLAACNSSSGESSAPASAVATEAALPDDLIAAIDTADTITVGEARGTAQNGDSITLTGVIGGHYAPFTDQRAVFVLADESIEFCADDHCATPWDACCELPDKIVANIATIQVVDEQGQMIRAGLEGHGGLEPLANVTVQGTVTQSDDRSLVVNADHIQVNSM